MAEDFRGAFPEGEVLIADFPELLSKLYTTTYWANIPAEFHCQTWKAKASRLKRSIGNLRLPCEYAAEQIAWEAVHNKLDEWNKEFKIDHYKAVCFSQPHGHKRVSVVPSNTAKADLPSKTAMFTAFSIAMHIFKTEDAVFTTDRCFKPFHRTRL